MKMGVFVQLFLAFLVFSILFVSGFEFSSQSKSELNNCKKQCNEKYTNESKECISHYDDSITQCEQQWTSSLQPCDALNRTERRSCITQAREQRNECKKLARQEKKQCKENAQTERKQCKERCKDPAMDRDHDGVLDEEDNCPSQYNPSQDDLDQDHQGDVCDTFGCCNEICESPGGYGVIEQPLEQPEICRTECFEATLSECRSHGGAVQECLPLENSSEGPVGIPVNFTQANLTQHPDFAHNLSKAINDSMVFTLPYTPTTYDCDDFAHDLEENLTSAGFNATFTAFWCTPSGGGARFGHAVTDVHLDDGTILFIEPQTGKIINIDFDGDGLVEARDHHPAGIQNTDDSCAIEIYDNRGAAQAAGVPID